MTGSGGADRGPAFVFAGGGSGGHIYPGIAIAEQLRASKPGARALFLCSEREIDRRVLEREGWGYRAIPARPFGLSPRRLVPFVYRWGSSVRASRGTLRDLRAEGHGRIALITIGGFVAAPAMQAARVERAARIAVNLDAVLGRANRWIGKRADERFTSARVEGDGGWEFVGPVVRERAVARASREECRESFGLDPGAFTLLVTGGSQGARSINDFLMAMLEADPATFKGWQVIHQAGSGGIERVRNAYRRAGVRSIVVELLEEMGRAWGAADLSVCRCGAGTVGEAWANRVPCLFLPYPYHKDEHQRRNAAPLVEAGGARLTRDRVDPASNLDDAGWELSRLLGDPGSLGTMRRALEGLPEARGAEKIARYALGAVDR